jgi:ArsR family transcriptional regulator, repressor of sdpIR and other operons
LDRTPSAFIREVRGRGGHVTRLWLDGRYHFRRFESVTKRLPLATLSAAPEHVDAFKALAHPGRLQVFFALVKARREMAAGEVQEAVGMPGPTVSHHLDQLRRAGLLTSRRQERFIYYSVGTPMVTDLVRLLTACC